MNKWQIICPLVAIAIVAVVFAMVSGRNHHCYYVYAQTRMIGQELITATNSTRLVQIGSGFRKRLSEFLVSPAGVAEVELGDEPSPIGDGTACSRVIVSNATGGRLGMRLRQDAEPERFHVLGFWTITEPDGPANRSQPTRAETNRTSVAAGSDR
ncbi:MAG TPA: hypothetical protein P5186_15720 [Candidatus Paceibacterota bacterium]|nr:hypothetical protein [Candidatus Paceibacterota bacterium]